MVPVIQYLLPSSVTTSRYIKSPTSLNTKYHLLKNKTIIHLTIFPLMKWWNKPSVTWRRVKWRKHNTFYTFDLFERRWQQVWKRTRNVFHKTQILKLQNLGFCGIYFEFIPFKVSNWSVGKLLRLNESRKYNLMSNKPPDFAAAFWFDSCCNASDVDNDECSVDRESNSRVRWTCALIDLSS